MQSAPQSRSNSLVSAQAIIPTIPKEWEEKKITLEEIPDKIENGSKVYIGSCGATAEDSLGAMVAGFKLAGKKSLIYIRNLPTTLSQLAIVRYPNHSNDSWWQPSASE